MLNNGCSSISKIALIIHSLGIGGMERVMAVLINHFSTIRNVELHLVLIGKKREIKQDIPSNVIVHKPLWDFDNTKRTFHTLKTMFYIRRTIKSIQPLTILSFGEMWNNLFLFSVLGTGFRTYISDRSEPGKNLGKLHNILRSSLYPYAKGYIAQTTKAAEIARVSRWASNITVISNPVKQVVTQRNSISEMEVLNVGRLIPTKHIDELILMFGKVNTDSEWILKVVGGNAKGLYLLEEYRELVIKEGLQNQVELLGQVNSTDDLYLKAEIFAFTSSSEGFPNALAEAMAAGCACIAYDCVAGPSDIIDDGINGFLIPMGAEQQYMEKLKMLMSDENLRKRFSIAAREKMKQFDARLISQKYFKFITEDVETNN